MRKLGLALAAVVVGLLPTLVSSPAEAADYKISAKLSKTWIKAGESVVLSGALSPATPNKTVTIQRSQDGHWVTKSTVKTNSKGQFTKTLHPSGEYGTGAYRVLTSGKGGTGPGKSKVVRVGIYAWFPLAYIGPESNDSDLYYDSAGLVINGQDFGETAWMSHEDGYGKTVWLLDGLCMKVKGTVGLDDSSDVGSLGQLKIKFKGPDYGRVVDEDYKRRVTLNINDTELLTIRSERVTDGEAPIVGFGSPMVFCKQNLLTE